MPEADQVVSLDPSDHTDWVRAFVHKFLKKFSIPESEYDELVGVALLGLVEAAEHFDESKEVPFRIYARIRIRGALLDGLSNLGGLSRSGHARARALRALTEYREQDEIARRSQGSPEEKLAEVFQFAAQAAFVHRLSLVADDGEEVLADESASPETLAEHKQMSNILRNSISILSKKERIVIEEYYFKGRTFDEIGVQYEMSKGWISKVHKKAVLNLKKAFTQ